MKRAAAMLQDHRTGVTNSFALRIANAVADGSNPQIGTIQKTAHGFRNQGHFRTAALFRCGGLALYPATHPIPG